MIKEKVKEEEKPKETYKYITVRTRVIEFSEEGKKVYGIDKMSEVVEKKELVITKPPLYKIKIKFCNFSIFNLEFKLFDVYAKNYRNTFYIKSIRKVKYTSSNWAFIIKVLNISYPLKSHEKMIMPLCNSDINALIKSENLIVNNRGEVLDYTKVPESCGKWICPDCEKCEIILPEEWFEIPLEIEKHLFDERR